MLRPAGGAAGTASGSWAGPSPCAVHLTRTNHGGSGGWNRSVPVQPGVVARLRQLPVSRTRAWPQRSPRLQLAPQGGRGATCRHVRPTMSGRSHAAAGGRSQDDHDLTAIRHGQAHQRCADLRTPHGHTRDIADEGRRACACRWAIQQERADQRHTPTCAPLDRSLIGTCSSMQPALRVAKVTARFFDIKHHHIVPVKVMIRCGTFPNLRQ